MRPPCGFNTYACQVVNVAGRQAGVTLEAPKKPKNLYLHLYTASKKTVLATTRERERKVKKSVSVCGCECVVSCQVSSALGRTGKAVSAGWRFL